MSIQDPRQVTSLEAWDEYAQLNEKATFLRRYWHGLALGPFVMVLAIFHRILFGPLTGQETEPWEIIYFKVYKSQLQVIEQALETAGLMLGDDRSRGYCLEMICADFLAGANLESQDIK